MSDKIPDFDYQYFNSIRNKAELPLYFVCVLINVLVVMLVFLTFIWSDEFGIAYYIAFIYLFVNLYLSHGGTFSMTRLSAVKISNEQFPEIYSIACKFANKLGLKSVPDVYVKQEGGILNAFASYFFCRNYVVINSDVFDVAYLKNKDISAVSFILAHEMAHVYYNHSKFWYNMGILLSRYIPILYQSLSRAREFSCDNVAKTLCPEGMHGIFILLLGKHLYDRINIDAYINQAKNTHGWFEFYNNLKSTHPVPVRRILALYNQDKQRII